MQSLKAQYFAMRRVKDITWKEVVDDWPIVTCDVQSQLMQVTVLHPLNRLHPPSSQYRRVFLKYVISQLESANVEVCDELYEEFTSIMSRPLVEDELCYKTYFLGDDRGHVITMEESVNLVSRGTTGLQTWPAAQRLAEWTLAHSHILEDRCVLELGSGLGFTGLVVCQSCHPKQYIFTDCHKDVLDTLKRNIALNIPTYAHGLAQTQATDVHPESLSQCSDNDRKCDELYLSSEKASVEMSKDNLKGRCTSVRVVSLDWEKVTEGDLEDLAAGVDVFLAADVVYDTSIIDALVRVIQWLLSWPRKSTDGRTPVMYIASTVRNTDTRDSFLKALESVHIRHTELSRPAMQTFFYDQTTVIDILQLTVMGS